MSPDDHYICEWSVSHPLSNTYSLIDHKGLTLGKATGKCVHFTFQVYLYSTLWRVFECNIQRVAKCLYVTTTPANIVFSLGYLKMLSFTRWLSILKDSCSVINCVLSSVRACMCYNTICSRQLSHVYSNSSTSSVSWTGEHGLLLCLKVGHPNTVQTVVTSK